ATSLECDGVARPRAEGSSGGNPARLPCRDPHVHAGFHNIAHDGRAYSHDHVGANPHTVPDDRPGTEVETVADGDETAHDRARARLSEATECRVVTDGHLPVHLGEVAHH